MKPQQIGQDRAAQHRNAKAPRSRAARYDIANISESERDREQRDPCCEILDAIADPQAALRRQQLEQNGARTILSHVHV